MKAVTMLVALAATLLLACGAMTSSAAPAVLARRGEVDTTVVQAGEVDLPEGTEEFFVTVVHIEDDVNDATGQVDAEHRTVVALKFDVNSDLTVTVNGQTVPAGYSQLQVEAAVYAEGAIDKLRPVSQLTVQVFVGVAALRDETGQEFHRVVVQERVVEVEGDRVWQAVVRQQVVDLHAGGALVQRGAVIEISEEESMLPKPQDMPPQSDDDDGEPEHNDDDDDDEKDKEERPDHGPHHGRPHHGRPHHGRPHHGPQGADGMPPAPPKSTIARVEETMHMWGRTVMDWYSHLPFIVRIVVAFLVGMLAGFFVLGVASCLGRCCSMKCKSCKCSSKYDDNLRTYAVAYTAVPLDEKKEKLKEESGSAEMV